MSAEAPLMVLVVAPDGSIRERIGGWLQDAGVSVMGCPGPCAPDYECIGGREGRCPLADGADVVLLDTALPGDAVIEGMGATDLLSFYLGAGKRIVALCANEGAIYPFQEDAVQVLWPFDRDAVVRAVRQNGMDAEQMK